MECKQRANLKDCGCSVVTCGRRGICCECIRYHRKRNELPGCFFPAGVEKTHERSARKFAELMG